MTSARDRVEWLSLLSEDLARVRHHDNSVLARIGYGLIAAAGLFVVMIKELEASPAPSTESLLHLAAASLTSYWLLLSLAILVSRKDELGVGILNVMAPYQPREYHHLVRALTFVVLSVVSFEADFTWFRIATVAILISIFIRFAFWDVPVLLPFNRKKSIPPRRMNSWQRMLRPRPWAFKLLVFVWMPAAIPIVVYLLVFHQTVLDIASRLLLLASVAAFLIVIQFILTFVAQFEIWLQTKLFELRTEVADNKRSLAEIERAYFDLYNYAALLRDRVRAQEKR